MIRILICDSDKEVRGRLRRCVERHFADICSTRIKELGTGRGNEEPEMLSDDMRCDVLILRIEEYKKNLNLAKFVLEKNPAYQLIAYSRKSEMFYFPELFELNLTYYFLLERTEELLPKALEIVRKNLRIMERQYLVCNSRYQKVKIFFENVIYIEHNNHVSVVYTNEECYHIRRSLNELEAEFALYPSLLRCHVSYIVNMTYVMTADRKTLRLKNGRTIPISRSYSGKVRQVLAERNGGQNMILGYQKDCKNVTEKQC